MIVYPAGTCLEKKAKLSKKDDQNQNIALSFLTATIPKYIANNEK